MPSTSSRKTEQNSWQAFDKDLLSTKPLAEHDSNAQIGLYFPRPEIIPNLPEGEWHYQYNPESDGLTRTDKVINSPEEDARVIVESQLLSLRLRSRELVRSPGEGLPPQPRRDIPSRGRLAQQSHCSGDR